MKKYSKLLAADQSTVRIDITSAIKKMVAESIPFIVVGSGITFGKFIDQFTFEPIMLRLTDYDKDVIGELFSLFSFNADKLIRSYYLPNRPPGILKRKIVLSVVEASLPTAITHLTFEIALTNQ